MKKIVSALALALLLFASSGCSLMPHTNKPIKVSSNNDESSISIDDESLSSQDKTSNSKYSSSSSGSTMRPSSNSSIYQPPEPEPSSSSEESSSSINELIETHDNSGLNFKLSDTGTYYIITGLKGDKSYYANKKLYIDDEHDGIAVSRIAEDAFKGVDIGAVVLPESIDTIGYNAFAESSIKSINIPSALEVLTFNVFAYSSLENIEFANGVKAFEQQAFIGTPLKSIVLPPSVEEIGISCFQNCYYLESVTLNSSLKTINTLAFCRCESLRSITIPVNVSYMRAAFFDCRNIKITIDEGNTYLKLRDNCLMSYDETVLIEFLNKNSMTEYRVPSNVQIIGIYCFAGTRINTVIIDNTIDYIEGAAFNSSYVKKIIFVGTSAQWENVIRYSGPIEDVDQVVIDENYGN